MEKTFDIPIFFGELRVVVSASFHIYAKMYGEVPTEESENYSALFLHKREPKSIIYTLLFRENPDHSTIAHEITHAVTMILSDSHIPQCEETDEVRAYITGWVTEQVYSVIQPPQNDTN